MDSRLIDASGETIRFLGITAVTKDVSIIEKTDAIVENVKLMILSDPQSENIEIVELSNKAKVDIPWTSLILKTINEFGAFYSGATYEESSTRLKSIRVHGDDNIFFQYMNFAGIENLITIRSFESYAPMGDHFTIQERVIAGDKIDEILERVKTLELGQEVIYDDVCKELNEMKALLTLDKKNWKQLLVGKIMDMVASGIISETASKQIIEWVKPFIGKLLG